MAQQAEEVDEGLQAPLLGRDGDEQHEVEPTARGVQTVGGTMNLVKCVLGAGLLAIPRAFALLGVGVGTACMAAVTLLTILTIQYGLVNPSVAFGQAPSHLRVGTYSATVRLWVGKRAETFLSVMMIVGLLGFQASCMDIITDILLGNEHNQGLLRTIIGWCCKCRVSAAAPTAGTCPHNLGMGHFYLSTPMLITPAGSDGLQPDLLGWAAATAGLQSSQHLWGSQGQLQVQVHQQWLPVAGLGAGSGDLFTDSPPSWLWLLDRRLILAQVVVLILPLSLKRHMGSLAAINGVGVVSLFVFLGSIVWLAVMAVRQGVAHPLPLWPDYKQLGSGPLLRALNGFGVISVLLTATACHSNVHPLMSIVKPFSRVTVTRIVVITQVICLAFYLLVSVCSLLVFGPGIQEDVLTNLSVRAMSPLVGTLAANILALLLRVGYMVSVMGTAVLNLFPLRQAVADLILGPPPQQAPYTPTPHTPDIIPSTPQLKPAAGGSDSQANNQDGIIVMAPSHHTVVLRGDDAQWQAAVKSHAAWRGALHVPLTVAMLGGAYVMAVAVPSIWVVISLVGSVSITVMSFMMPAAVGLAALKHMQQAGWWLRFKVRSSLRLAAVLGALMFLNGFVTLYLWQLAARQQQKGKQ